MKSLVKDDLLFRQTQIFKALSHQTRLAILHILAGGEKCVNEMVELLEDKERTGVSKHLAILRKLEIIGQREEGLKRIYFLKAHCLLDAVSCTLQMTDGGKKGCCEKD